MGCFTSKENNLKQNSNLDEDLLLSLPDEIIEEIMSYLSYSDLYNLSDIGKRLRDCTVRARKKMPFSKFHSFTSVHVSLVKYFKVVRLNFSLIFISYYFQKSQLSEDLMVNVWMMLK